MCRIVTGRYCVFVSIFCVTVSLLFSRLSVTEQDCSFVCLNSLSPYQSYSPSPVLSDFLSTVPTSFGKCITYNRSFGEGLTGGNFVNTFEIVTYMVYSVSLNNRIFCLQGLFVGMTKLRNRLA